MPRRALSLSLPVDLVLAMERVRGKKPKKTRSQVAAELIRAGLASIRERELGERDAAAYRKFPESASEKALVGSALKSLSLYPF